MILEEQLRLEKLLHFESKVRSRGFSRIAGVDEAGRGPLAGPVVAAACIIPEGILIEGINDSKKLTPKVRRRIFDEIKEDKRIIFGYSIVDETVIDEINILQASILAMKQAIKSICIQPDFLLVDGMSIQFEDVECEKIIKGDSKSLSIAAASIIAKEIRDDIMAEFCKKYPEYGFSKHKGYGTKQHMQALQTFGPSPIHRKSFAPVRNLILTNIAF